MGLISRSVKDEKSCNPNVCTMPGPIVYSVNCRSKSSRRDESPYGVKSIVPSRDPSPSTSMDARKHNQRKTFSSPSSVASVKMSAQAKTRESKSSPPSATRVNKNLDAGNKGQYLVDLRVLST